MQLTDGNEFEASSAWYATRVNVQNFVTDFTFQVYSRNSPPMVSRSRYKLTPPQHSESPAVRWVMVPTLSTGTGGIPNSVAVKFDLYDNFGEGIDSTGLYVNGASPTIPFVDMTGTGIDLHSGDLFDVHMIYGGWISGYDHH